jgi:hypothetical protein
MISPVAAKPIEAYLRPAPLVDLAIRSEYDEVDYPQLFVEPHPAIVETLLRNDDAIEMYLKGLPDRLTPS